MPLVHCSRYTVCRSGERPVGRSAPGMLIAEMERLPRLAGQGRQGGEDEDGEGDVTGHSNLPMQ